MLKLRVKKLLNNIEAINSEYPGIVLAEILGYAMPGRIHKSLEIKLKDKVRRHFNAICDLTRLSESDITSRLVKKYSKFNIDSPALIKTEAYGEIIGIDAYPFLYEYLLSINLVEKSDSSYRLTTQGERYGGYLEDEYGKIFIGWNKYLLDFKTENLKSTVLNSIHTRLFHMTHINNLSSILEKGLFSHSKVEEYTDISDKSVNSLRNRIEQYHDFKIHDYVPFYFNPRNAMLYRMQKEYYSNIVILEIDKKIIIKDYTLFSEGNAARKDSSLISCKYNLLNFPWLDIYSKSWHVNGFTDQNRKSLMQSECLIYDHVPVDMIKKIHCSHKDVQFNISQNFKDFKKEVVLSNALFF